MFTVTNMIRRFILMTLAYCLVSATEWHLEKNNHRVRRSTEDELRYWAGLSNESLFNETLTPIAISRVPGTHGNAAVRNFIKGELEALQWDVKLDPFRDQTPIGEVEFTNIVATQNVNAPRHLVLACHFDSKMDREKALVLATDSAVPCAMLVVMAKQLDWHLKQPRQNANDVSLRFIFFDGEENFVRWTDTDSLYGSRHLARLMHQTKFPLGATTNELDRMDVMVLLDLLGSSSPTIYNYFKETKDLFTSLANIENRLHKMNLLVGHSKNYFVDIGSYSGVEDDHIPFLKRGVRVLHLIPQPFPDVWHQETDIVENLHFPTIDNLNKILRAFVAQYLHLPLGDESL